MASKKLIYSADFKKTLHEKIKQYAIGSPQRNMLYAVLQWLDKEPRIDAESVRHGRWIEDTVPFCNVCPECGAVVERHCVKHNGSLKRCPNCGAKMDAEVNNG